MTARSREGPGLPTDLLVTLNESVGLSELGFPSPYEIHNGIPAPQLSHRSYRRMDGLVTFRDAGVSI
jgi:hypothetical protein